MKVKEAAAAVTKIAISTGGLVATFFTVLRLMGFLSYDPHIKIEQEIRKEEYWLKVSWCLLENTCLLSLFMFQHSFLALKVVKDYFASWNLKDLQRSIYVLSTCLVLQLLIRYWSPIPGLNLWSFNTKGRFVYWSFITLHIIGWLIIYVGSICMDLNDLLGVKQVYYSVRNLADPSRKKSPDLLKLYSDMRHPSFIGFAIIFWCVPVLSLDRLLLAFILTYYMYLAWKTDLQDCHYQRSQYIKKFHSMRY